MSLTYYYYPMSQPSRAILAFLELTGIEHEKKVINILTGEQKAPEYLKINPNGAVPAIDDAGFPLFESEAIVRYLLNTRKGGEELYPSDPKVRSLVDRYFPFHHANVRPAFAKYFVANFSFLFPKLTNPPKVEEVEPTVHDTLKKLESIYLADNKYIAGDNITIADLFAMGEITMVYYTTKFDFDKYPKVKAYIERLGENPVINKVNQPVITFLDQLKQKQAATETK